MLVLSHAALRETFSDDPLAETLFQAHEAPKVEGKSLIQIHRCVFNNICSKREGRTLTGDTGLQTALGDVYAHPQCPKEELTTLQLCRDVSARGRAAAKAAPPQ